VRTGGPKERRCITGGRRFWLTYTVDADWALGGFSHDECKPFLTLFLFCRSSCLTPACYLSRAPVRLQQLWLLLGVLCGKNGAWWCVALL
jgi:hypothetical protein